MLCRKCRVNEVPPRQGKTPGRPRTLCFECKPYKPLSGEEARRQRERVKVSHAKKMARGNWRNMACGCDRDYLTVPLEEAHRCPYPRPLVMQEL